MRMASEESCMDNSCLLWHRKACWMWWLGRALLPSSYAWTLPTCSSSCCGKVKQTFWRPIAFGQKWSYVSMEKVWICSKIHPLWLDKVSCFVAEGFIVHPYHKSVMSNISYGLWFLFKALNWGNIRLQHLHLCHPNFFFSHKCVTNDKSQN